MVRIIAGEFGSRRLVVPPGRRIRPTGDRARESLFAALGDLTAARVLDLFAGSGALGLEALSRGAASCVFCERAPVALEALRANVDALGVADRVRIVPGDALRHLGSLGGGFDLVLLDPPYGEWARIGPRLARHLPQCLAESGRIVAELPEGAEFALTGFGEAFNRRIGSARLVILSRGSLT
jgi:16S rRNA (guanine966-N2)-methyltransferase